MEEPPDVDQPSPVDQRAADEPVAPAPSEPVAEVDAWDEPWPGGTEPPPDDGPLSPGDSSWPVRTTGYPADLIARSQQQHQSRWLLMLGAFAAAFVGALLAIGILGAFGMLGDGGSSSERDTATPTTVIERITTQIVTPAEAGTTTEAVAAKVVPSIVTVNVGTSSGGTCSIFASGSGVVIDDQGRIATNHHVVDGSDCQEVISQSGHTYEAELLGSDALTDVAVLLIDAATLTPIDIGSTGDLAIGQQTIAVGNPLGQIGGASLTAGVLSAVDREVDFDDGTSLFGMLQTDAAITQGSSGGALVDADGRLIGITAAIGVSSAGAEGIGYAIPVEVVQRIAGEIIEHGTVDHAFLGIQGQDDVVTFDDGSTASAGALVSEVLTGTSAESAGLQVGDVIVAIEDQSITTMNDLVIALRLHRVGDFVTLTIDRGDTEHEVTVVLGLRPPDADG